MTSLVTCFIDRGFAEHNNVEKKNGQTAWLVWSLLMIFLAYLLMSSTSKQTDFPSAIFHNRSYIEHKKVQ